MAKQIQDIEAFQTRGLDRRYTKSLAFNAGRIVGCVCSLQPTLAERASCLRSTRWLHPNSSLDECKFGISQWIWSTWLGNIMIDGFGFIMIWRNCSTFGPSLNRNHLICPAVARVDTCRHPHVGLINILASRFVWTLFVWCCWFQAKIKYMTTRMISYDFKIHVLRNIKKHMYQPEFCLEIHPRSSSFMGNINP